MKKYRWIVELSDCALACSPEEGVPDLIRYEFAKACKQALNDYEHERRERKEIVI